jgi:hypothetical protein
LSPKIPVELNLVDLAVRTVVSAGTVAANFDTKMVRPQFFSRLLIDSGLRLPGKAPHSQNCIYNRMV